MPQHIYDGFRKVDTIKTDAEVQAEGEAFIALLILGIAFAPILYVTFTAFRYARSELHWHVVFAALFAGTLLVAAYSLLKWSRLLRISYGAVYTCSAAIIAFQQVQSRSDLVWAAVAGLAVFIVGAKLTYESGRPSFTL